MVTHGNRPRRTRLGQVPSAAISTRNATRATWHPDPVSYDVFFKGFKAGDAARGGGGLVRSVLEPYVSRSEPEHSFLRIEVEGGGADVYLNDDDMMVNNPGGTATWDLLVSAASRANWTLLLVDGPPCITNEDQRAELPAELADEAVAIRNGTDLLRIIADL